MILSINLALDEEVVKRVNHFRFNYDRRLIKSDFSSLPVFGPCSWYTNIKGVIDGVQRYGSGHKNIKLVFGTFTLIEQDSKFSIFYIPKNEEEIKYLYDDLLSEFEYEIEEPPEFMPGLAVCRNMEEEDCESLYSELSQNKAKIRSYSSSFVLNRFMEKEEPFWEVIKEIEF